MTGAILHGYWRSTTSYRVRIALNLKGVAYDQRTHDLRKGEQRSEAYRALNAQGLVPALEIDGTVVTQSLAILEWLEEVHPTPALLPPTPEARAVARAMAALIACDIHPLNNLRVLNALRADLAATDAQVQAWIARWSTDGFAALESLVQRHGGAFAFGDNPTLADCFLVPQIYAAERFAVDLTPFPCLAAAGARARALPAFAAAHPDRQLDADPPS
jgi:maleylpyruvate isomerase